MKFRSLLLCIILIGLLGTSCVSQRKLSYLREVTPELADSINKTFTPQSEARIVPGDILTIMVNAMDAEAVQVFNLPVANAMRLGSAQVSTSGGSLQGYWVNPEGDINFPVLGQLHVQGLTTSMLKDTLQALIGQSVREPIVTVAFQNFHVTVLGEVKNPGRYTVADQRITLLEGLGLAGDLTIYGKRNNVLISREVDGKMQFARVNLNDASLFSSPFYYLQQNDVIYVEPNNARSIASQNISLYLSMATTLGSMATVIVSVVTRVQK